MQRVTRQKAEHRRTRPYTSTVPSIPPCTYVPEVTEQKINLECTVTEVLNFYCISHDLSVVTLPEGQLRSPKETLMSVEFLSQLLLGNKELRDSCSEQLSHHFSLVLWAVLYEMQLIGSSIL